MLGGPKRRTLDGTAITKNGSSSKSKPVQGEEVSISKSKAATKLAKGKGKAVAAEKPTIVKVTTVAVLPFVGPQGTTVLGLPSGLMALQSLRPSKFCRVAKSEPFSFSSDYSHHEMHEWLNEVLPIPMEFFPDPTDWRLVLYNGRKLMSSGTDTPTGLEFNHAAAMDGKTIGKRTIVIAPAQPFDIDDLEEFGLTDFASTHVRMPRKTQGKRKRRSDAEVSDHDDDDMGDYEDAEEAVQAADSEAEASSGPSKRRKHNNNTQTSEPTRPPRALRSVTQAQPIPEVTNSVWGSIKYLI